MSASSIIKRYSRRLSSLFPDRSGSAFPLNPSRNDQEPGEDNIISTKEPPSSKRNRNSLSVVRNRLSVLGVGSRRRSSRPEFHLPNELWELIFSNLTSKEIWNLRSVSRNFRRAVQQYIFLHCPLDRDTPALIIPASRTGFSTKDTVSMLSHVTSVYTDLVHNTLNLEISLEEQMTVLGGVRARFCILWLAVAGKGYQVEFEVLWVGDVVKDFELKSARLMWYPYRNVRDRKRLLLDGWRAMFHQDTVMLNVWIPTCDIAALFR